MPPVERLRLRLKVPMTVHELYNCDKTRFAARYCKSQAAKVNRRAWKQSMQQGFDGDVPRVRGHW